ncbi:Ferredoxin [Salmonella enterica subsp. enterica serovar Senftenberg str. A4-543]|uniref:Ferredoxin n=1 Tax=Salmonella enterica subsp. enterica serovar Senftenberg str. A4-543 TaxID=913082 RepID=G5QZ68_SALSE|nr:Ferredoxin [Salmonella enterica subsp. enterica serovar Senftenberg str. A4-543]
MAGTNQKQPHCKALIGTPGENVSCAIYENRPSTCREFSISGEGGEVNEACNRARARYMRRAIAPARAARDTDYRRFTKICFSIQLLMLPL